MLIGAYPMSIAPEFIRGNCEYPDEWCGKTERKLYSLRFNYYRHLRHYCRLIYFFMRSNWLKRKTEKSPPLTNIVAIAAPLAHGGLTNT